MKLEIFVSIASWPIAYEKLQLFYFLVIKLLYICLVLVQPVEYYMIAAFVKDRHHHDRLYLRTLRGIDRIIVRYMYKKPPPKILTTAQRMIEGSTDEV